MKFTRLRFQFGLRTLLVCATLVGSILGVRAYRHSVGGRRLLAAHTLQGYGIEVLEAGHSGAGYSYSVRTGDWSVELHGVRRYEGNLDSLFERLLGDAMSADRTVVVIPNLVRQRAKEIQRHIGELPNLQTIYVNDRIVDGYMIEFLKRSNPSTEVRYTSGAGLINR